jgi:hypothetical protein
MPNPSFVNVDVLAADLNAILSHISPAAGSLLAHDLVWYEDFVSSVSQLLQDPKNEALQQALAHTYAGLTRHR